MDQNRALKLKLLKGDADEAIRRGALASMVDDGIDIDDEVESGVLANGTAKEEEEDKEEEESVRQRTPVALYGDQEIGSLVKRHGALRGGAAEQLAWRSKMPAGRFLGARLKKSSTSIAGDDDNGDDDDDDDDLPPTFRTRVSEYDGTTTSLDISSSANERRRSRARMRLAAAKEKLELSGKPSP